LATFAKYCWAFPCYYVDYVKKDIAEMVDMLMEDLDLAVRARGENSLPESPISRWYQMGGSDLVMFYMFCDHLTWRGHTYTTKAKRLLWNDVEKRPMLPPEDNEQAKKVWEQLETKQAAERGRDETLKCYPQTGGEAEARKGIRKSGSQETKSRIRSKAHQQ